MIYWDRRGSVCRFWQLKDHKNIIPPFQIVISSVIYFTCFNDPANNFRGTRFASWRVCRPTFDLRTHSGTIKGDRYTLFKITYGKNRKIISHVFKKFNFENERIRWEYFTLNFGNYLRILDSEPNSYKKNM